MSIGNNDVGSGGKDVVKTQLASAYEDGVTGYGEFAPTPNPIDQQYIMKSTDPNDPFGPSYEESSASINDDRIQSIASIKIDPQELSRYNELILARGLEDMLDESVARQYFTSNISGKSEENKKVLDDLLEKVRSELFTCSELLTLMYALERQLTRFEQSVTKGTLITAADTKFKTYASAVFNIQHCPFRIQNFDANYHKTISNSSDTHYVDVIKSLSDMLGSSVSQETIKEMTISSMITQSLYDTEIAIDYGVSPRFMVECMSDVHGEREKTGGAGSSPGSDAKSSVARHYTVKNYLGTSNVVPSSETRFVPAAAMFGYHHYRSSISASAFNDLQPSIFSVSMTENPVDHAVPNIVGNLPPMKALVYLSSLIANEFSLSQGIVNASKQFGHLGVRDHLKHFLREDGTNMSVKDHYKTSSSTPGLGKILLGASKVNVPVHSVSTNSDMGMMNMLRREMPIPGQAGNTITVMPLEAIDSEMDLQDGVDRVGYSSTIRDFVGPIVANPFETDEITSFFGPLVDGVKSERLENFRILSKITTRDLNDVGNAGSEGASTTFNELTSRNLLGKVIGEFGKLISMAAATDSSEDYFTIMSDSENQTAFFDLIFISKYLKPEGHPDNNVNRKFLKNLFLCRACALALTRNPYLLSQNMLGKETEVFENASADDDYITLANRALTPSFSKSFAAKVRSRFKSANSGLGAYNNPLNTEYNLAIEDTFLGIHGTTGDSTPSRRRVEDLATAMARVEYFDSGPKRRADVILVQSNASRGTGKYKGVEGRAMGSDMIDAIFGGGTPGDSYQQSVSASGQLIKTIHSIVDEFLTDNFRQMEQSGGTDVSAEMFPKSVSTDSNNTAGNHTVANGMDRSQLYALILEMFVILANEFLSGESVLPEFVRSKSFYNNPKSIIHNHLPITDSTMHTWLRGRFGALTFDLNYNEESFHYVRLLPKIADKADDVWGQEGNLGLTLSQLGKIMTSLGSRMRLTQKLKPTDAEDFWDVVKSNANYPAGGGDDLYAVGRKLGETTSLSSIHSAIIDCARESSAAALSSMPAYVLLERFVKSSVGKLSSTDFALNLVDALSGGDFDPYEAFLEKAQEMPDKLRSFLSNVSLMQVYNAGVRLETLSTAFALTNNSQTFGSYYSPFATGLKNARLDRALKLLVDEMNEEGKKGRILFYGIPKKLTKSRKIALSSNRVDVDLTNPKGLIYKISFQRNTEMSSFVKFEQDFRISPKIIYDSNFKTTRKRIAEAMGLPGVNTLEDLVDRCVFTYFGDPEHAAMSRPFADPDGGDTLTSIHGTNKTWSNDQQLRDRLKTILRSELLKYLFERVTNLSVSEVDLTYSPTRIISRKILIDILKAGTFPEFIVNTGLSNDPEKIVDALFEPDTSSAAQESEIEDPIVLIKSQSEFLKAFQPVLVRTGNEAKFESPIATPKDLELVQVACHSPFVSAGALDEAIFTPTIFDEVIAVFKDDFVDTDAYTITAPDLIGSEDPKLQQSYQVLQQQVGSHFGTSDAVSDNDIEEYFKQTLNSPFRIDNYRPIFEIDLE